MTLKLPTRCIDCVCSEVHRDRLMCGLKKQSSDIIEILMDDPYALCVDEDSIPDWCSLQQFKNIDEASIFHPLAVAILSSFDRTNGFCKPGTEGIVESVC